MKIDRKQLCFKVLNILHTIIFIIGITTVILLFIIWFQFEFCGLSEDVARYLDLLRACGI